MQVFCARLHNADTIIHSVMAASAKREPVLQLYTNSKSRYLNLGSRWSLSQHDFSKSHLAHHAVLSENHGFITVPVSSKQMTPQVCSGLPLELLSQEKYAHWVIPSWKLSWLDDGIKAHCSHVRNKGVISFANETRFQYSVK